MATQGAHRQSEEQPKAGKLRRLGEWCARHFVVVIVLWLLALGALHGLQSAFGGTYEDNFTLPNSQSQKGLDVLAAHDPAVGGYGTQVVLHDNSPLPGFQSQINQTVANLQHLPHVLSAQNPLPPPGSTGSGSNALSKNQQIAFITVRFDEPPASLGNSYIQKVDTATQPLRAAGVQVEYGGALGELARPHGGDLKSEGIGFVVAVVVLIATFGSLIAAVMPLLSALLAVICGLSILSLVAISFTFATVSPTLATMLGLGVGIDYALFLITRHRQQLMDGHDPVRAAGTATTSSGRAIVVSGCSVIVALLGLYASSVQFIGRLGVAAAITVITGVIGALTLVPALFGLVGRQIDRFHLGRPIAEAESGSNPDHPGSLYRYAHEVARRPWWFLAAGVVIIGILAIPVFSIQLGHVGDGADPTSFTDRRAFDLISEGFGPGANGPLTIVVDQTDVPASDRPALAGSLQKALTNVPGAASISPPQATPDGDVLISSAISATSPQDHATNTLFNHLKDDVLPGAVAGTPATTYITGTTAAQIDFLDVMTARLPIIIGVVVFLAFLIVLLVFRAPLVALKAAVLNLVSITASYGVLVAIFQWGWGGPGLGVNGKVPIESYVPTVMFAIVFGLSMDYEVFLISRVHEAWSRTRHARDSVVHGLEITARVITAAALIMVSVFAAFLLNENVVVKMIGLGLAVSVLIDATVVRLLLVPAVMMLMGEHAWWCPRWLDRVLPHIDTEGTAELSRSQQAPEG